MQNISEQIRANNRRVYLYMFALTTLLTVVGIIVSHLFGWGITGTSVFITVSILINILSYFYSDKVVLTASRAKKLNHNQIPELFSMVEQLCRKENLPVPKLYLLNEQTMNAFATGRNKNHAVIAVTRGLLEKLKTDEVEGVIAHELSHIKNSDMRLMTIVAVIAGLISLVSDIFWYSQVSNTAQEKDSSGVLAWVSLALAIFAPLTAFFIQLAISRKREYVADATAVSITNNPNGLAYALEKISLDKKLPKHVSPATAHLYFSSPGHGETFIDRLFSTHPPIEERIRILRQLT